jgi:hypothetical protein
MIGNPILTGIGQLFFNRPAQDFHCVACVGTLRSVSANGPPDNGHGVRIGNSDKSESPGNVHRGGSDHPRSRRSIAPAASPSLAGWLAAFALHASLLLYSPRWLFLIPVLLMMMLGGIGVLTLSAGNVSAGSIHLGVHTMLYAAMTILVGYQAVIFSAFTKVYAISEVLLPEAPRLNRLFRFVKLESDDRVLDIGCADGALFHFVPDLGESVGVEPGLDCASLPEISRMFRSVLATFPKPFLN